MYNVYTKGFYHFICEPLSSELHEEMLRCGWAPHLVEKETEFAAAKYAAQRHGAPVPVLRGERYHGIPQAVMAFWEKVE